MQKEPRVRVHFKEMFQIEAVQLSIATRAGKFVEDWHHNTPVPEIVKEFNWLSLGDRRRHARLSFLYLTTVPHCRLVYCLTVLLCHTCRVALPNISSG